MSDGTQALDRRTFLRRGLGMALAVPAAGVLATLSACGDGAAPSAPAAPATPAPVVPAAPAAPPQAASPGALITDIASNAGLVTSLQYANESPVPEQHCSGCQLYTPVTEAKGKCVLFLQGLVAATGHCSSWVKKQA